MSSTDPPSPLTTVFTPSASCKFQSLSTWLLYESFDPVTKTDLTNYNILPSMDTDCVPSGYNTKTLTATPSFSPGVCPHGYSAAASFGASSTFTSWCCPKGLDWTSNTYNLVICYSSWTQSGFAFSQTETETRNGSTSEKTKETYLLLDKGSQTGLMMAQFTPIIVTWASSDLPQFTPASAPLLPPGAAALASVTNADSSGVPAGAGTGVAPIPSSSDQVTGSSGLSPGAKVGIGVGVGVGGTLVLGLIAWFLLRRRRKAKVHATKETYDKAELHGEASERREPGHRPTELGEDTQVHEMGVASKPSEFDAAELHELPSAEVVHEVPGDAGYAADVAKK